MKKVIFTVLFIILAITPIIAENPIFLGGSSNLNGGNNIFIGYQITDKFGLIFDYYGKNIVSFDFLYTGFVISNGFSLDNDPNKRFTTLLYTPKIFEFADKWKIFGKIGLDFAGPINKIHMDKISTIIGIGLRWN